LPGLALLVCSPPTTVSERVRGLRAGADDWITKPCHPEEVLARIQAVLRRRRAGELPVEDVTIDAGELAIRSDLYDAFVGDRAASLSRKEFELLRQLALAESRVLEREDIYQRVWGYTMARGDRSVDVFVRKLRAKLEAVSPGWRYVHTHFGVGYRFGPEPVVEVREPDRRISPVREADRGGAPADPVRAAVP
jgi:DNA-binding response OmpR family regulator